MVDFPSDTPRPASSYPKRELPEKLRIAFIHPDLGIGGAERLVVDAAVGLQGLGHHVEIFTSFHQDGPNGRSFSETRDGTLSVHVLGDSVFPPAIGGRFKIVCSILRQLHLSLSLILAVALFHLATAFPLLGRVLVPRARGFTSSADWSALRQLAPYDVLVVDQLSASIPLLRMAGLNRVVFYCHFPDLLLAPDRSASPLATQPNRSLKGRLRALYRLPLDKIEEVTTGSADKILVNSSFTAGMFQRTFKALNRIPRVVYPAVDVHAYDEEIEIEKEDEWILEDGKPFLLSINRFEGKKDVALAVEAFALARAEHQNLRLVVAGGYDQRLADNVQTLLALQKLADSLELSHYTYAPSLPESHSPALSPTRHPSSSTPSILFLLNVSTEHKRLLLTSPSLRALLYTPSYEHLGVVPLEAMSAAVPVLATASGGPLETILDHGLGEDGTALQTTGLLRQPNAQVWATAIKDLVTLPDARRRQIGEAGRKRTSELFSVQTLAREMETACRDAASIGKPIWQEDGSLSALGAAGMGVAIVATGLVARFA